VSPKSKVAIGIGAALIVAVLVALLRPGTLGRSTTRSDDLAKGQTASASRSKSSSEAVLGIAPGVRKAATATRATRVTPLMAEFVASHDNKSIYERLKKLANPTAEEQYVMAAIIERCADITDQKWRSSQRWHLGGPEAKARFERSLSQNVPDREKRLKAFDAINYDECAGFDNFKVTEKEVRAMHERAAAAGDPKSRAAVLKFQFEDQRRDAKDRKSTRLNSSHP